MKRLWSRLLILSLLTGTTASAAAQAQEKAKPPKNIILIGWDGAQRNHLYECLGRGALPNLRKPASEGSLVDIDIRRVTDTKAGWSQVLTGYNPNITGIYSNRQYQPVPKASSIFERLEKRFGSDDFVTVAVIGTNKHCGEIELPKRVPLERESVGKRRAKGGIVDEVV